jgi:hypothetical protein
MSIKQSPIVAKVIFKDGNRRFFAGTRFEKELINVMVYHIRKMLLSFFNEGKIREIQIFDNTKMGDRLIFEYKHETVLKNDLASYLGNDYNPPKLK